MDRAVFHQQETIRQHQWFPFNACSRLKRRSSRVSFRTYSFPSIYDLQFHLKGSTAGSFADDTRLIKQISSCDDVLILQEDLNTEYQAYRTASSKLLEEPPFTAQWVHYSTPSGQDLTPASSVKDLGVHLSPDMKWSLKATIAVQNANKMASWVLSAFSDRSKDVLLTLYKIIVRSRLEYCCPVWNPSSMLDIKKLESTQRAFTRYISGCQL